MKQDNLTNENKEKPEEKEVSIHIDKQNLKSPNPTTGDALYLLGNVNVAEYELFREVRGGKGDDEPIANNNSIIDLKNGDHFYTVQKNLNPGA